MVSKYNKCPKCGGRKPHLMTCIDCGYSFLKEYKESEKKSRTREIEKARKNRNTGQSKKTRKNRKYGRPVQEIMICQSCDGTGGALGTCVKCGGRGFMRKDDSIA